MLLFILIIYISIQQPSRSICREWTGKRQWADVGNELKTCQNYCVNILKPPLGNCLRKYLHTPAPKTDKNENFDL